MDHGVYYIKDPAQKAAFSGLILPGVLPRLEEPAVFLIGAVEGALPVGAAVMELEVNQAQIISIAVAEDRRRQGIGMALLRQCIRMLHRTTIQSLYAILGPEEADAAALFAAFGMETSDADSAYYHFTLADAAKQAILHGKTEKTCSLEEVPKLQVRDYLRRTFPGNPELSRENRFDGGISQLLVEKGKITACLLAEWEDQAISISWVASHSREKLALLYLLRGALNAASEHCAPETEVRFATYESLVTQLTKQLIPQAEKHPIQSWELSDGRFRLTDTAPTGWETTELR